MRRRAVLAVAVVCVACGDTAGPYRMREGQLSIAPVVTDNPVAFIEIGAVRIRLTRIGEPSPFLDTTVAVSPNQTEFAIDLSVPITGDQETLLLSLVLLDPAGVEVYRNQPDPTTVTVGVSGTAATPITIPIEFCGPGADAVILEITETDLSVYTGDTVRLSAIARDEQGQIVADARIGWMALDPLVTFDDPKDGLARAGTVPGEARVVAMLPVLRAGAPPIEDTATVVVRDNPRPTADAGEDFTVEDTDLNGSEQVTLDGSGSSDADGTIQSYVWSEGGNQIATGVSPTVNLTVGAHTITLTVTDNGGATDTDDVIVTVTAGDPPPSADAGQDQTVSDADGTGAEPVTLDGSGSRDPAGTIVSYVWSESGNQIATDVSPTVNLAVGVHTITLTVTDDGDASDTDQVVVTVVANQAPTANAGPDQTVTDSDLNESEQVTLDGSGSSDADGTIVSYVWSEGGSQLATGVSPTVNLTVGAHTITLTVTDNGGATDSDDVVVTVTAGNRPPSANAGQNQTVTDTDLNGSEQVTLNGSGSSDADGTIVSYGWSEGGSQLATGVNPTVNLSVGAHTITLTVTDNDGATDSDDVVVTVTAGNQPPSANAGQDQTVTDTDLNGSEQVTLNASGSSDPDGTIVSYVWSEGGSQLATGVSPTVNLTVGAHTITLTVTDNGGATDSDDVLVTVTAGNRPPSANAGQNQTVTDTDLNGSEQVTLNGSGSSDADGTIVSYGWSEGGSQLATGVNPTVNLSVGAHTITLTVTDNDGATDSDDVVVTVTAGNQPPSANAGQDQTVTDTDLNGSEQVTLNGSGSSDADGTIVSYVWSEGGSQLATGVSPTVNLTVGAHTLTLTVTDNGGATDSDEVLVTVTAGNQPPTANAGQDQTVNDADGSGAEPVTLNGSGSSDDGTIIGYDWSEGGNSIATGVSPTVNLTVGVHTITLTVTDNGGATDTDQVVVTVVTNQAPTANAGQDQTVTDTDLNGSEQVTLNGAGSSDADGTIVSYVWSEGGSQLATGVSPTVNLTVGAHTITLTVTDNGGATDTDQVTITVQPGQATLTVSGAGSGSGTVTSSPAGISCTITDGSASGDCTQSYQQGTVVTLTATPSATAGVHQFIGWSGTDETCPGTGPCDVTMDSNQNVTANFIELLALTVQGAGTGSGTVTGASGGIDCTSSASETQGSCTALIEQGVTVTLSASAEPGSSFTGWSGACSGTGSCQVTMNQAQTVTASFTLSMATLTLTIDGLGSVASQGVSPALNCSYIEGQCSASYPWGTQVTLVASSLNPDFAWESWFGTGTGFSCTTSPTCVVTMDQDRDVRAWFSSPGLISVNPSTAAFTMLQAGTPSPSSTSITVSNSGQRPVNLAATQISYSPVVAPWLNATIDKSVIDTLSPATMTLSIIPNNLDPGEYTAAVYVGDFVITVGQVNVTLTVSLPNPTISNVSWQLTQLNDSVICGYQNPPGSLLRFDMNYSDADGDVNQSTAVLTVAYQFNPGSAGQFQQPPEPGMSVSGNGFSGTITSYICNVFSSANSVTETFTLQDAQGNPSNSLSITVPRPGGANAPPAGNPVQGPTSTASGGARVSGGSGT